MFKSMRAIILLFVAGLVIITTAGITFFAQREVTNSVYQSEYNNAQALIDSTLLNVSNEYQSLLFFEKAILENRKGELKDIIGIAYAAVFLNYEKYKQGTLTEKEAKTLSLEQLKNMRYDNWVGYIWINDTGKPVPSMIMHTTLPELDGKILDDPRFNTASGNSKNLFVASRDICEEKGAGYVEYLWPKPSPAGLTEDQPKISYVKIFKEWNWIIGSGVYVDDIETDVRKRFDAMLHELQVSLAKIKLGKSGYIFIFTGNQELVVHPTYAGMNTSTLRNPETGELIGEELIKSSNKTGVLEYMWDKPPYHLGEFKFKKRTYVRHFEPLDWYVCSSIYVGELEQPGILLRNKIILLSLGFLALALAFATILSRRIAQPLLKLTAASRAIGENGISAANIPVGGPTETRELGMVINQMINSVRRGILEKEHLVEELKKGNEELSSTNEHLEIEINEHARVEKELLRLRNHLKNIIDSMPSILVGVDNKDRVTQWNSGAEIATGFSLEEALNRRLYNVFPELSYELKRAKRIVKNGKTYERVRTPRKVDNEIHYGNITIYPLIGDDIEGAVIRLDDVTARVQIEEIMIQTEKMMSVGGLAAGMAHEINNPLGGILQGAQNIERRLSPDLPGNIKAAEERGLSLEDMQNYMEERKIFKMLNNIRSAAERAAKIMANMLDFSRKTDVRHTSCQMTDLVDKALALAEQDYNLKKNYDFKQINIVKDYAADLPFVVCAPTEIEQVLLNLLGNAAHAMSSVINPEAPAQITIRVKEEDGYVTTEVEDNGPGMDKQTRKRVFEPFFTTKPKGVGTGLGLSVSYFIVTQNHGGTFSVDSAPGKGTKFIFQLPINR
ncbi:cache domain-containing protein [Maridesulfovibrio ferrireducens]|uniref:cache domain-containing protein n=1 Tax=Maridesulfovibrio ferrireducens TaxID=246191 RepID=UPI001A19CD35|nr:cache domain-containing protein [Maridesulfovibrio ferrireducens]MBI9112988.1 cache domain-containing protein [Maridesulfovibrio ferrireducens]